MCRCWNRRFTDVRFWQILLQKSKIEELRKSRWAGRWPHWVKVKNRKHHAFSRVMDQAVCYADNQNWLARQCHTCACRKSNQDILVVQSAEN